MATKKAIEKITSKGVPPLKVGIFASDETRDAAIKRYVEEQYRRMESLADSLDIPDDPHRWYALALHLAMHHVPELKDAKPMGAPKKWGDYELGVLVVEIGHNREVLETAYPALPFTWLEVSAGDQFVFMLHRNDLL